MFKHFSMKLDKIFRKPQRRKADEGVRIAHLDPETRMNFCKAPIFLCSQCVEWDNECVTLSMV